MLTLVDGWAVIAGEQGIIPPETGGDAKMNPCFGIHRVAVLPQFPKDCAAKSKADEVSVDITFIVVRLNEVADPEGN